MATLPIRLVLNPDYNHFSILMNNELSLVNIEDSSISDGFLATIYQYSQPAINEE